MPSDLNIVLCQMPVVWESAEENCRRLSSVLERYFSDCGTGAAVPDVLVFPEFFSTGFTMNREAAQGGDGFTLGWMKEISQKYGAAVVGSVAVSEDGKIFNRCYFVSQETGVKHYDKRHLFRMGEENEIYSAGSERVIVGYKGWNIALNVCYDLRFPVWSRNAGNGYDLMINVASWPSSRIRVTEPLVKARAIENMSYFAFVNRTGEDPSNSYSGGSMIVSPKGDDMASQRHIDGFDFYYASLSYSSMKAFREKFPAWMDGDKFEI